ncbi:hypothetical protein [Lactococcus lactis]|uniref:Uncharacterized protein n=3 Tax=Lactococcus lactis TaxID=1358 RepID=A0A5M9PVN0_LACLH|nr:hypothetical protein [Lactococcus lactis]KAA8699949.1 hypothetical protein F4V48_11045 [Lactococcus lactis subsp. hordniae]MCT3135515.1 hypothetical protein [Lactococcus lactis]
MPEINTILVTSYGADLKYLIDINNYPEGLIMLTQLLLQYSDYFEQTLEETIEDIREFAPSFDVEIKDDEG